MEYVDILKEAISKNDIDEIKSIGSACFQTISRSTENAKSSDNIKRDEFAASLITDEIKDIILEDHLRERDKHKMVIAARTVGDGNCLYNSLSLALIGNDSLAHYIRLQVSADLYLNSEIYANHKLFENKYISNPNIFQSIKSVASICFSDDAFKTHQTGNNCDLNECVKREAILNCNIGTWSSMMCVIASSNVLQRTIRTHYPVGGDKRIETVLNSCLTPNITTTSSVSSVIDILWACSNLSDSKLFSSNHFVPLFISEGTDYVAKTDQKKMKHILIAQKSKTVFKSANLSTKKGRSINFNIKAKHIQNWFPKFDEPTPPHAFKEPLIAHKNIKNDDNKEHMIVTNFSGQNSTHHNKKRKLTAYSDVNVVLPGSSKQQTFEEKSYPLSNAEYVRGKPLYEKVEVNKYDIGLYMNKKIDSNELFDVITNLWRPDKKFEFPITMEGSGESKPKRRKTFLLNWLNKDEFKGWLSYSKLFDGAFCYPCVFFGHGAGHNSGKIDLLYKSPLTCWTSANSKFNDHHLKCKMHHHAISAMQHFLSVTRGEREAINVHLDRKRKKCMTENRAKLLPIIKTVVLCGKQTIPLRGHRDDETLIETSQNRGNFQELLDFRIDSGDIVLKEHFKTAPKNATYRSKTIQNEIISCVGEQLQDKIVNEIKKSGIFSILADETPDISKKEQLAISLRFVDNEGDIQEKFVRFVECDTGTSAKAVSEKIKNAISNLGLDICMVRGQGYDGASNMSGKNAGVAKLIQEDNALAIYIHCFAHRLNLCVAGSCKQQAITSMMDKVRCVSEFFSFPKRAGLLRANIEIYIPQERRNTLLDVCKTRWIARIDGLDRFEEMFEVVMVSLQSIRDNIGGHWNEDSRNKAASLFSSCSEFSFLISLVVSKYFLYLLLPLTAGLQEREIDIKKAYGNIEFVKKNLTTSRASINKIHEDLYERAEALANFVGVVPSKPRTCRNLNRDSHNISTVIDYFRATITIPFVEHIISEIATRFGNAPIIVIKGFSIIPHLFISQTGDWKSDFIEFATAYRGDIPSPNSLAPELLMWETYWRKEYKGSIPSSVSDTLKKTRPMMSSFPNVYAALRVLATIPVTSCECERAISVLRRVKTYLRNTMHQERLNALSLMSIHRKESIDFHDVINRFARKHPRRMELINIFDTTYAE